MRKKLLITAAVSMMCISLAACGTAKTDAPDSVAKAAEKVTEKMTEMDQEKTIQDATQKSTEESKASDNATSKSEMTNSKSDAENQNTKLSGKVVVYMPSPSGLNEQYIDGFKAKTGLEVELFEGTTGEILARLEAEKDNPVADVVVLASWADGLAMKESGQLASYTPADVDKVYTDWVDGDNMLFGTSASALGVIYNTTLIEELNADWAELADAKYKDMLAIPDPEKSGSCKDFLSGYMYANGEAGWKVWEDMAANGMKTAGANKAALEAVTTGEKAILVAGVDYNAYSAIEKGEPLGIYYPKSGTVINPRPAMILNSSKNEKNAQEFIDYLISDDAQKLVADAYLLPGRLDIQCANRTNVEEIPTFELNWDEMMKDANDAAAKLNSLCQ